MNNNATLRVFIGKGLGSFDGGFAVAVLNDNVTSVWVLKRQNISRRFLSLTKLVKNTMVF
jgi:hypothetical protein